MKILNVHERELQASPDRVGRLVDSLASRDDALWPKHAWPRMEFDRALSVGARGGHGPIRYFAEEYVPGESITFRFTRPKGFAGCHGYERIQTTANTTVLRHTLEMTTHGLAVLSWPLVYRPMHDALIEDSLATAEASLGQAPRIQPWSLWVRFLRWVVSHGKARAQPTANQRLQARMTNRPPDNWNDKDAWDRYFNAQLLAGGAGYVPDVIVLRFLTLAREKGGRIWFPGCGLDRYPMAYAERGCTVLATDLSPVAVEYQRRLAAGLVKETASAKVHGTLAVAEHDFTEGPPDGRFDVVINCRAFQGLSSGAMGAAAKHFYAALRPGGACIIDTMNVQGDRRNVLEDSLMAAGFYIPFQKSTRWYREQLDATGIVYLMVLGRPHTPAQDQYPPEHFRDFAARDQNTLDSLRVEYEDRCQDEAAEVNGKTNDPATIVARVVYATG